MKKITILLSLIVLLSSTFLGRSILNAMADEPSPSAPSRYFTSVQIRPGDSLWSMASQYSQGGELSMNAYIKELKAMNRLKSDTIHAGQYLTVMYFVEEGEKVPHGKSPGLAR